MYSAYKLNKQGDNVQLWRTPFPVWDQSVVPCPVLTVASWPAYRFLKRQVRWSGIQNFPQFIVIHTVEGFDVVNKAEIDSFLELSCFFYDQMDVGNLICASSHNKLWKILKEMGIPHHLTCLLRNLYGGQDATVRTGHGTTDWSQTGKGVCQGCILSPCLFNLYAEYIMRNAGLDEAQAGIKIAGKNINNLR